MKSKIITGLNVLLVMLILFTAYNNILVLDDFHPSADALVFSLDDMENKTAGSVQVREGYYIQIDLDSLILNLYKDGSLIRTYPVSGGKADTPSPTGTWKVISKSTWGEGFGGSWLGLNVPWGKYGIHGTKAPWFIGKQNASHGCIRMNSKNAKELFEMVPHGTTVTIVQNEKPFRTLKSGDIGSDVLTLQRALKKLGYFHDWASGKFGDNLKRSVIKFQKSNKYRVTGTVSKSLYDIIMQRYEEKLEEEKRQLEEENELDEGVV